VRPTELTRFLFVSQEGAIPDLAATVRSEGHEVRLCILDPHEQEVGNGLVDKVLDWQDHVSWADVIVFDYTGFGVDADRLRTQGHNVVGGTAYTDRLEMDREFAQDQMKDAGLDILPRRNFESSDAFDEAIAYVRRFPQRFVFKPNGCAQSDKSLTFVGREQTGRDMIAVLEKFKRGWGNVKSFQLQQYAEGVEVAVGGFFNGNRFILPACVNFEYKRMCNGDIGPNTGEMGTLCFWDSRSRLVKEGLLPMEQKLAETGYRGYFDVSFIATPDRLRPLEFTPRFGYPTINLQIEGVLSPWGQFLRGLAKGQAATLTVKPGFQMAVVVAVPPFPWVDKEAFERYSKDAAVVFANGDRRGVHPCDIRVEDGEWLLTGTAGYAVVVTGTGQTVDEAREEVYDRVGHFDIPNRIYRTDIGNRWHRDADLLYSWNYLR
jgi:phosphoribosylamine--glycine ligase